MVAKAERDGNLNARERDRKAYRNQWYLGSVRPGFSVLTASFASWLRKSDHGLFNVQLRLAVLAALVGEAAS